MTGNVRDAASGGRAPRRQSTVRRGRYWLRRFVRSDTMIVTVLALAMTLSAFAVYQATRAADESDDLLGQSRIVRADEARQTAFLQTVVDHDLDVLRRICTADLERDVALVSYLGSAPDLGELITTGLTLDGLRPLLLGDRDATCTADDTSGYSVERARERLDWFQSGAARGGTSAAILEHAAAATDRSERFLMVAGLLFALIVAVLIAVDQLDARDDRPGRMSGSTARRWQDILLVAAGAAALAGVVLLGIFAVDSPATWMLLAGLALVLAAEGWWLRRRATRRSAAADRAASDPVQPAAAPAAPRPRGARPQWWAEMIGAMALVVFTASAVGLSLVSIQERESNARADHQAAIAIDLQRVGQQEAIRALGSLSLYQEFDAQQVAARQLLASGTDASADPDAVQSLADAANERLWATDGALNDQARSSIDAGGHCVVPAASETPLASDLYYSVGRDADLALTQVLDHQQPSQICDLRSALSRAEARLWSGHASLLTVALVVLGLAGFLLALAASSDRTARSSRMLLAIGAGGLALGTALAVMPLPSLLAGAHVPSGEDAQAFAEAIVIGPDEACATGEPSDVVDAAIARYDGYGPAFSARATIAGCVAERHLWPATSSELEPAMLGQAIGDMERALSLGPATAAGYGNLGWYYIYSGIADDDDRALRRGLEATGAALAELAPEARGGSSWTIFRFNEALALAALGEHDAAVTRYHDTVRCLGYGARCPNGVLERAIADDLRIWALADLELLGDDSDVDAYRAAILGLPEPGESDRIDDDAFDLFPQEVQILDDEASADDRVVWYYRPDDSYTWAVLRLPTLRSMYGGGVNRAVPASWLLESGEYRADLYTDGRVERAYREWSQDDELTRWASYRLGLSIVVPSSWYEWVDDGVQWHFGPDRSTGVTLTRIEGMLPDELHEFLERELPLEAGEATTSIEDGWFLGLDDPVVRTLDEVDARVAAGLESYGRHWGCGGALFAARIVSTEDSPSAADLFDAIVLERPVDSLPHDGDVLRAEGVSLELPSWWDGVARPDGGTGNLISGKDCAFGANFLLSTDQDFRSLGAEVDATIASFRTDTAGFPSFTLETREPWDVSGADAAELLTYTWLPAGRDDPVRQWQLHAKKGDVLLTMTLTTFAADTEFYQEDRDIILPSVRMDGE